MGEFDCSPHVLQRGVDVWLPQQPWLPDRLVFFPDLGHGVRDMHYDFLYRKLLPMTSAAEAVT